MSSELERRLEAMLADAPEPDPGAGEKALHRALHSLQPATHSHRGLRTAVLVFATAVVLLVIAAGSLAAAGALHVSLGAKPKPAHPASPLTLPQGANGVAAIIDGRLSVVTRDGGRLQVRATAAALSPRALYVAVGSGNFLVAMAPDGRRAWSHPAGGKVVAIAWAPDGFRIAYIVHAGRRFVLHVIYGNGVHDTTIDRSVRPVRPSWRADSLAFAYVGGGGKAIVYDFRHESRTVVPVSPPVTGVAFAPRGASLAVAEPSGVWVLHQSAAGKIAGTPEAFGWLHGHLAVAGHGLHTSVVRLFAPDGASRGSYPVHGIVASVTPKLVIVRLGQSLVSGSTTLATIPRRATVRDLTIG
jgi:hypothetical protein